MQCTDYRLLAFGLAMLALAIHAILAATLIDDWLARRAIERARRGHEARKRLARGLNE